MYEVYEEEIRGSMCPTKVAAPVSPQSNEGNTLKNKNNEFLRGPYFLEYPVVNDKRLDIVYQFRIKVISLQILQMRTV